MRVLFRCFMALWAFAFLSCSEDQQPSKSGAFNRTAMLQHYADSLIRPDFDSLNRAAQQLSILLDALTAQPDVQRLSAARSQWHETYRLWLTASVWMFGPAESSLGSLRELTGTFPVNESRIEQFIQVSDTSFQNFERDTRGLFALDYLLFNRANSDNQIIAGLASPGRAAYLRALGKHFQTQVANVNQRWIAYRNDFLASAGTDAGSSITQMYNAFLMSYEFSKNFRLGLPMGLRPGQQQPEPEKVEALHSRAGKTGIITHLNAIHRAYKGGSGVGFDDYVKASFNGQSLYDSTSSQWARVTSAMLALPATPLDEQVSNQQPELRALNEALTRMTRFYKSEMASLLGLTITYSSNDGD